MRPALAAALLPLAACATIVDGTTQPLHVATTPPGAACVLTRQGLPIASIEQTPGTVRIARAREEVSLLCQLPGHEPARAFLRADTRLSTAATIGDYALLAGPAYAIDDMTGADLRYRADIRLTLPPSPP